MIAERKSPRQLLKKYLAGNDKGGIPLKNIDWVEKKINDVFREPMNDREMQELYLKRTHDLYYILACAREAGDNPLIELSSKGWEPKDFKRALPVHDYLHALSKKDFEKYDFGLIRKDGKVLILLQQCASTDVVGYIANPLAVGFENFLTAAQAGESAKGGVKRKRDEEDDDESEIEDNSESETEDDTESEPEDDAECRPKRAKGTVEEDQ